MSEQNQVATQQSSPKSKGEVVYQVAGQDVKLSYQIVRDFLTKGNGQVSDQDLVQFISICKYNQLNPFLNEAYLVKFGSTPAQMIVSKEALMKRAEACENYEGFKAGIIVLRNNEVLEVEGCFMLPKDELVGGWAEVHRSDRKFPTIAKIALKEYDKQQSTWKEKPSTMSRKVAIVQALREAFPTQLGAMYTAEEQNVQVEDISYVEVSTKVTEEINQNANKETISMEGNTEAGENKQTPPPAENQQGPQQTSTTGRTPSF